MLRRQFIKTIIAGSALLLNPLRALAQWNKKAFFATELDDALSEFFPERQIIQTDQIRIGTPAIAENGAVVPIKINTRLENVSKITIFVEKNPNPLVASFDFATNCKGFIATRIKIAEPSRVLAIAESENRLYRNDVFVDVIEGGCA